MMVYVASDYQLHETAWDPSRPGFHVVPLTERDEAVRRQFSKSCVYYAGAQEGCGCGFQYGQYEGFEEDPDRLADAAEMRQRFVEFVKVALQHQHAVEVFSCWDGDQAAEPVSRESMPVGMLDGERWFFREKERLVLHGARS